MNCNRCGRWPTESDPWTPFTDAWPAPNGVRYGCLCPACVFFLYDPEGWEEERLEMVPPHSE
jgi:hypothetical protein